MKNHLKFWPVKECCRYSPRVNNACCILNADKHIAKFALHSPDDLTQQALYPVKSVRGNIARNLEIVALSDHSIVQNSICRQKSGA